MGPTDVRIPVPVSWASDARCLLTGESADLRPVKLRRMIFVFVAWFGEDATVPLPLSRPVTLVHWQYLRMFRAALGVMLAFPLLPSLEASGASGAVRLGVAAGSGVSVWFVLGWILDRVEPVRLLGISRDRRSMTLRFSTVASADRARSALQLSDEA